MRYEHAFSHAILDSATLRALPRTHCHIQADLLENVAIVIAYDEFGSPFPIYCIRKTDGAILWKGTVWADQADMILTKAGAWHHSVYLSTTDDRVIVVGSNGNVYCEAFDLHTGKNCFRFSTSYWNGKRAAFFVGNSDSAE